MALYGYGAFRELANPGGTLALDGLPEWPVALIRANGFDGGIAVSPTDSFPISLTCNAGAIDAIDSVDEFDWFFSQGKEVDGQSAGNFIVAVRPPETDTYSGTLIVEPTAEAAALFPDPFDVSTIPVLFFAVDVYVRRRSDGAIQRLDLQRAIYEANAPKVNLE